MMNLNPLDQAPVDLAIEVVDVGQEYVEYDELDQQYMELIQEIEKLDIQPATGGRSLARRKVQGYSMERLDLTCKVWPKR